MELEDHLEKLSMTRGPEQAACTSRAPARREAAQAKISVTRMASKSEWKGSDRRWEAKERGPETLFDMRLTSTSGGEVTVRGMRAEVKLKGSCMSSDEHG